MQRFYYIRSYIKIPINAYPEYNCKKLYKNQTFCTCLSHTDDDIGGINMQALNIKH